MTRTTQGRRFALQVAVAAVLMLPACSDGTGENADDATAGEISSDTLAAVVNDADDLSVVSGALGEAGLAQVFDGVASYTIFAPQDAAFDALGAPGEELRDPEQRPALVAVLRDHIVPGYLTPDDIGNAIEQADSSKVTMRTMGGHTLTFSADGDAIVVTHEDGSTARFSGDALRASNGVAIPVDAVLMRVSAPTA